MLEGMWWDLCYRKAQLLVGLKHPYARYWQNKREMELVYMGTTHDLLGIDDGLARQVLLPP